MTVLICKNIKTEGPVTIEDYLKRENIAYKIFDLSMNESVPDPDSFDTLIVMGGTGFTSMFFGNILSMCLL